jgi:outer membrane PBP1 activator LpoA protein
MRVEWKLLPPIILALLAAACAGIFAASGSPAAEVQRTPDFSQLDALESQMLKDKDQRVEI